MGCVGQTAVCGPPGEVFEDVIHIECAVGIPEFG
jgi:hypothetical protein